MKKILLFLVAFVLLSFTIYQVTKTEVTQEPMSLKVLSHNVLGYSGHPVAVHETDAGILKEAIQYYQEIDADVIVLQESPTEATIKQLASALDYNYVFFEGQWQGSENYPYGFPGAILSKFEINTTYNLQKERNEISTDLFDRYLGIVEINTKKGVIQIAGMHLCADYKGFKEAIRIRELALLFDKLPMHKDYLATLLVGDFNSEPSTKPYNAVINEGFIDTQAEANYLTVKVPELEKRIDFIFMKADKNISYKAIPLDTPLNSEKELYLSDHRAILTEFSIE